MPFPRQQTSSGCHTTRKIRRNVKIIRNNTRTIIVQQKVTDSCHSECFWRTRRTFMYLLCLAGLLAQSAQRLRVYIYNSSTVNVKHTRNFTLTPPCISICPDFHSRYPKVWPPSLDGYGINNSYSTTYELLKDTNMTVNMLWNNSRIISESLGYLVTHTGATTAFSNTTHHNGIETGIEVQEIASTIGICTTFCALQDLPYFGSLTGIRIIALGSVPESDSPPAPAEYKLILHSKEEIPDIRYFAEFLSVSLPFDEHIDYRIRLRQHTELNTWQDPCVSLASNIACSTNCLDEHIMKAARVNCRLPYIKGTKPMCTTPEEFKEVYNITKEIIYSDVCNSCIRACNRMEYSTEYIMRYPNPTSNTSNNQYSLFLCFAQSSVEVVEEAENYSLSSFFSDFGGALGLFLGESVFSIYEATERLFCSRNRKK